MKRIVSNKILRMNYSEEEFNRYNQIRYDDLLMYFDNNIINRNINNILSLHNNNDEDSLYSLWKNNQLNDVSLNSSPEQLNTANKLMNRGYLVLSNGKFEFTDKGKNVIVNKSLSEKNELFSESKSKKNITKTSSNELLENSNPIEGAVSVEGTEDEKTKYVEINGKIYPKNKIPQNVMEELINKGISTDNIISLNMKKKKKKKKKKRIFKIDLNKYDDVFRGVANEQIDVVPYLNSYDIGNYDIGTAIRMTTCNNYSNSKLFGLLKTASIDKQDIINEFNNRKLKVTLLADNSSSHEKGLMFHSGLKEDECALFIFDKTNNYSFWNKNVSFPIDVAFFNEKGNLIKVCQLDKEQLSSVASNSNNVKYVIETNSGWFNRNNIKDGDSIYKILEKL